MADTTVHETLFPQIASKPICPIVLSISSGSAMGKCLNVISITQNQDAINPLKKAKLNVIKSACRLVQILYKLGKKDVLSIVDVMLGGCFGLDGKCKKMQANIKATIPASKYIRRSSLL